MKNVRTVIAAFAVLFAVAGTQAQELKKAAPARANMKAAKESMDAELQLTPEQKTKMDALRKKYAEKTRDLREVERDKRREQIMALQEERDAEVKTILTDEQYKKFVEVRKKRKEEAKERMEQRRKEKKVD